MKSQLLGFALALSVLFNVFFVIGAWQARQQTTAESPQQATETDPTNDAVPQTAAREEERREETERREGEIADRVAEKLELSHEQRDNFYELRLLIREEETLFRSSIEARRISIDRELEEESPDEERILMLQREIDDFEDQWRDAGRRYMESFLSTLTDDQRRAFFDMSRQKRRDDVRKRFDRNGDGVLDEAEEQSYRDALEKMRRGSRRGGPRGGMDGRWNNDRDGHPDRPPHDGPPPQDGPKDAPESDAPIEPGVTESAWLPGYAV